MPETATEGADEADVPFTLLGRFPVVADPETVAVYRRAVDLACEEEVPEADGVPPLFPVTWLGRPDIRARVYSVLGPDRLPVQTGHEMTFSAPIIAGGRYALALSQRMPADDRMEFSAVVEAEDGAIIVDMLIYILLIADDGGGQG